MIFTWGETQNRQSTEIIQSLETKSRMLY